MESSSTDLISNGLRRSAQTHMHGKCLDILPEKAKRNGEIEEQEETRNRHNWKSNKTNSNRTESSGEKNNNSAIGSLERNGEWQNVHEKRTQFSSIRCAHRALESSSKRFTERVAASNRTNNLNRFILLLLLLLLHVLAVVSVNRQFIVCFRFLCTKNPY